MALINENGNKLVNVPGGSGRFGIEDNLGVQDRSVDMGGYKLSLTTNYTSEAVAINNTNSLGTGLSVSAKNAILGNSITGVGIQGTSTSGTGLKGTSTDGAGVFANSINGDAIVAFSNLGNAGYFKIFPDVTSYPASVLQVINDGASTPVNGVGTTIDFSSHTDAGIAKLSNSIMSVWSNVTDATRASNFKFKGYNNGDIHILTFPSLAVDRFSPLSVNGNFANSSGNITISSGGASQISGTYAAINALKNAGTLTPGASYLITGVDVGLYGGTDIILTALTNNSFSIEGSGIFYVPKYDKSSPTFGGIWTNNMEMIFSNQTKNFDPYFYETVTANNGATGTYLGVGLILYLTGNWLTATSITASSYLGPQAATISGAVNPSYSIGNRVIWGGNYWVNVNGNVGDAINSLTLNSEWAVVPYNTTDYNVVVDFIEFDFTNNTIIRRKDKAGNDVQSSKNYIFNHGTTNIKYFQWGNERTVGTAVDRGLFNNIVVDSKMDCINFTGLYMGNNRLNNSQISDNYFSSDSYMADNLLDDGSSIDYNVLMIGSGIFSNVLSSQSDIAGNSLTTYSTIQHNNLSLNSYLGENTLINGCTIGSNTLIKGSFNYNFLFFQTRFYLNFFNNSELFNGNFNSYTGVENCEFLNSKIGVLKYNSAPYNGGNIIFSFNKLINSNLDFTTSGTFNSPTYGVINNCLFTGCMVATFGTFSYAAINLTGSTIVAAQLTYPAAPFLKEIFIRKDGTLRLKYYDNSDTLIVTNINA